ncbi:hypothetical protein HAX54_047980, partial [Datura stramonium]|nr:hypothetical protein [Datura stramonium]
MWLAGSTDRCLCGCYGSLVSLERNEIVAVEGWLRQSRRGRRGGSSFSGHSKVKETKRTEKGRVG